MGRRIFRHFIHLFSSLQVTVIVLILSVLLIFFATLAQVDLGLYFAKKHYLETWVVLWATPFGWVLPVFPGGLLLGWVLLINLSVAHFTRFKWNLKKVGIWFTHVGLIVLLIGGGLSQMMSVESQLPLAIGESRNYIQRLDAWELAIVSDQETGHQQVVSVPTSRLKVGKRVTIDALPMTFKVHDYWPNVRLARGGDSRINRGVGMQVNARSVPINVKDYAQNMPTAVVEFFFQGHSLGVWLLSSGLGMPQSVEVLGRTYSFFMRPTREYLPYSLQLSQFTHEVYPGTTIPKNFLSKVKIIDDQSGDVSEHVIYMNNPLRYRGKTFYQASFANEDTVSIFQVVDNGAWWLPYLATGLVFLGLILHFGLSLWGYLRKIKGL